MIEAILAFLTLLVTAVIGGLFAQQRQTIRRVERLETKLDSLHDIVFVERTVRAYFKEGYAVLLAQIRAFVSQLRRGEGFTPEQLLVFDTKPTPAQVEAAALKAAQALKEVSENRSHESKSQSTQAPLTP